MEKQKINVHFSGNLVDKSILEFLNKEFEITIIDITKNELQNLEINIQEKVKTINLIIFTGGEDVNPEIYNEKTGEFTHVNKKRDDLEFNLLHSPKISSVILNKIPKLGICRGAQLLTVYNGGRLIQHVTGHNHNNQVIEYFMSENIVKTIEVTSDHHQMMFPYNLSKNKYDLIGWSKNFQSNTYLNGENKEITLPENFLEPEIIYYPQRNSLCIQPHPEWCIGTIGSDMCLYLIKKYLFNNELNKYLFVENQNYNDYNFNLEESKYIPTEELLEKINNFKTKYVNNNKPLNTKKLPIFLQKVEEFKQSSTYETYSDLWNLEEFDTVKSNTDLL